ncbi:MAG: minor capsid protein [Deltaproteobacteria bacterium]|nr:minor capsid protein [Deltaproteobacteria bacterium]
MSIPKKLMNSAVKSQTALDQYSHHLNIKVQGLLKAAEDEIAGKLAQIDPSGPTMTAWKKNRLVQLNEEIKKILDRIFQKITNDINNRLTETATTQADSIVKSFNKAVGVDLFKVTLTPDVVKGIAENTMIDGKIIGDWWLKQSTDLQNRLSASMAEGTMKIQIGMLQGETVGQLIGRIRGTATSPGVMSLTKRQATALVRTSVMSVANATRMETFKANADVLDGFEWIATLDKRTTLECAALDGKRFDMDMKPVGHNKAYPAIPAHWGCRCCLVPVTKSWAELAGPKSPLTSKQIKSLDNIPAGERASMNGPVPAQAYDAWLKDQPATTQEEILGTGRFDLWKREKLDMADLINNKGRPIPLEVLKRRLND